MQAPQNPDVTRRALLSGSLAASTLALGCGPRAGEATPPGDVEALLREWSARAGVLAAARDPAEDAFVLELCAALTQIAPDALPPRTREGYAADGLTSGPVFGDAVFQVIEFQLAPGAIIRAHNHVGYAFVSLGVRGRVMVRHYEVEGEAPAPGADLERSFHVREVASAMLTPGRTSTLTRGRANIHWFQAGPEGATFYDFGVHFPEPGPGPTSFSVLEIAEAPTDARLRIHEARWLGNIYAREQASGDDR
ncbi:MAG: hypothetical protein KC636_15810 [Myxococcales bacterium]|nr:hypothetical protein [Myxococcales bacterium]